MAFNKVGFHIAANCGGCSGIDNYWSALDAAGIPFTVYSANEAGVIVQAARYARATLIYRDVEASTVNPADYATNPETAAAAYWRRTLDRLPAEIKVLKSRCWIELLNEPGREDAQADWVGWLMHSMALRAINDGYRVMGPGWAPGNPEPRAWQSPGWEAYLRLASGNSKVAVSLHEYSLDDDIHNGEPWLVGRFQFLFDACDELGIARPNVWITEAGWTLNSMPPDTQVKKDIAYLAGLYAQHSTIQAANLWTLQAGAGNGKLPQRLNALMPWLTQYTIGARFPDPLPPVTPPVPPTAENLLVNPSFDDGWTDDPVITTTQQPDGWRLEWDTTAENPYGQPYKVGEAVHKSKAMLPAAEQDRYVWDGDWTYKVFAGSRSFCVRLTQAITIPAGRFRLTLPVWVDCYRWDNGKDYDLELRHAELMVTVGGAAASEWLPLKAGGRRMTVFDFDSLGGVRDLTVHLRCNWAVSNNLWLDGWSLEAIEEPAPVPAKFKAIVVKLPQDSGFTEWIDVAEYAYEYRHDMTASHDTMLAILRAGNESSYVKLAYPERQADVGALITAAGYTWVPIFDTNSGSPPLPAAFAFNAYPVDGPRRVTQAFGARPEVYAQYGFPGHEGVDLQAALNALVVAVSDGRVSRITTTGNYGNRVDVLHADGWTTTYAHLNSISPLIHAGASVKAGQVIGLAGSTGNSTGSHLHFGLKRTGYTYTDPSGTAWPFNIFDPTPYLASYLSPPTAATIDLLPYFRGDGGRQFDMGHNVNGGGTQTTQVWHLSGKDWLYLKGELGEYERLGLRPWANGSSLGVEWIYRFDDTSESPTRFYAHYMSEGGPIGAPWLPRLAEVGKWYETSKFVQHYLKDGCAKQDGGNVTDRLRVLRGPRPVTYPESGVTLPDVITVEWAGGEQYDFAAGRGNVAFRDATRRFWFIGDLEGRPDKGYRKPGCIPLGW